MQFSDAIVEAAWFRSGRFCECERAGCNHVGRCMKSLFWPDRGRRIGGWEAHSKSGKHLNSATDCEILCWDCHEQTF